MTSFSNLILVYDKENRRFCWKILLYHYSLHPWEYFSQKFFVPMCTHSMEFDSFYRAGIYGRPCSAYQRTLEIVSIFCFVNIIFRLFQSLQWNVNAAISDNKSDRSWQQPVPVNCRYELHDQHDGRGHHFCFRGTPASTNHDVITGRPWSSFTSHASSRKSSFFRVSFRWTHG